MSTTTSGRGTQEVREPSGRHCASHASPAPVADAPVTPAEVLIEEARRRQRRRWAGCLLVAALVGALVAGLLASLPPSGPTRPTYRRAPGPSTHAPSNLGRLVAAAPSSSGCPTGGTTTSATATTPVTQSLDGAFSGCVRVGNVASGPYHVVLSAAITTGRSYRAPHEPRIHLSISPRSGRPGTRVTLTGVVSVPHELTTAAPPNKTSTARICWGGCPGGLTDSLSTVRWSSPTTFRMTFKVPAAPWIEVGPSGKGRVEPLTSGTYRIGVRCVGPFDPEGCGVGPAEATVSFRIVVPTHAHVARCPTPTSCAFLELGPRSAFPAQAVEVKGVAPLVSMIGTQPFGARLDVLSGPANGPEVVFGRVPASRKAPRSSQWIHMGDATLDVQRPPSFASLGHLSVLSETTAGLAPMSENPAAPDRVAHCAPGDVVITSFRPDGAVTTASVPTAGAVAALARNGFPRILPPHDKVPSCAAVALTPSVPDVLVAFQVAITPTYTVDRDVALQTLDDGATWSVLPVPTGATRTGFGGFRYQGSLVDSVFSPTSDHHSVHPPLVEQFDPASETWRETSLTCPSKGPCVTLGAFSWSNCAGGIHAYQELLHSANGGMSWNEPAWPSLVDPCGQGQLAAVSASTELLVHGSLRYPYLLLRSTDGGTTWSDVGLPRAPSAAPTGTVTGDVSLLSDGALLLVTDNVGTWELLEPGSQRWCMVRSIPASVRSSATFADLSVFDAQLWWVDDSATSSRLDHVDVSSIGC